MMMMMMMMMTTTMIVADGCAIKEPGYDTGNTKRYGGQKPKNIGERQLQAATGAENFHL
jgi:hypothetical protein